jgi:deoxyribonuclease V
MLIPKTHSKPFISKEELIAIQERLAKKIILVDEFSKGRVAGVDIAYKGDKAVCGVVVLDYDSFEIVERKTLGGKVDFPYLPTFLAFREADLIVEAIKDVEFDILMIDGQGIAHPRGVGIASHIGVLLDIPTIGVAKKLLCGEIRGKIRVGVPVAVVFEGRHVGYALKTKKNTRPIFISPGHKVSLKSSLEITQHFIREHKLPEPTRLAHLLANNRL